MIHYIYIFQEITSDISDSVKLALTSLGHEAQKAINEVGYPVFSSCAITMPLGLTFAYLGNGAYNYGVKSLHELNVAFDVLDQHRTELE